MSGLRTAQSCHVPVPKTRSRLLIAEKFVRLAGPALISTRRPSVFANQPHNAAGFDQSSGVFGHDCSPPSPDRLLETGFLFGPLVNRRPGENTNYQVQ